MELTYIGQILVWTCRTLPHLILNILCSEAMVPSKNRMKQLFWKTLSRNTTHLLRLVQPKAVPQGHAIYTTQPIWKGIPKSNSLWEGLENPFISSWQQPTKLNVAIAGILSGKFQKACIKRFPFLSSFSRMVPSASSLLTCPTCNEMCHLYTAALIPPFPTRFYWIHWKKVGGQLAW